MVHSLSKATLVVSALVFASSCQKSEPASSQTDQSAAALSSPSKTPASASSPLAVSPFKIHWVAPFHKPFDEEVAADGSVKTGDPKDGDSKFEGASFKVHGNVELTVEPDGTVTHGRDAKPFGRFGADDRTSRARFVFSMTGASLPRTRTDRIRPFSPRASSRSRRPFVGLRS